MELAPSLTPFWHTVRKAVESEPEIRFKLKPLTQPQIIELQSTYEDAGLDVDTNAPRKRPTNITWYRAGCLGMDGAGEIEGITVNGKPAEWLRHRQLIPYDLLVQAGVKLCLDAWGAKADETEKN
jgi:hypothetical protein